ncbi:hypothetical protein [uncultured Thalassolituus sp.]|uniref:hypothetical protein n=1 Tax=uncultured Thalassolituus sp. TaxID=285273 RepID=UPI002613805B|nr:hypothetical protein [uncultured Thalassolituus sp.]
MKQTGKLTMTTGRALSAGLATLCLALPAWVDCSKEDLTNEDNLCLYVVAGVNYSYLHPHSNGTSWRVTDEYGHGAEVAVGVHANEDWSVEISYADLGSAGMQNLSPAVEGTYRIDYRVPAIWAQYRLMGDKMAQDWDLSVRAGVSFMINKSSDPVLPFKEQTTVQIPVGVSLQWWPEGDWGFRLKLDSYDYDVYSLSTSLMYGF